MAFIYKITNQLNGKVYIGQTINPIKERWRQHRTEGKCNGLKYNGQSLYYAMATEGIENFVIEELEECNSDVLSEREKYWIKEYHSYIKEANSWGYNLTPGGEGGGSYGNIPVDQFGVDGIYIQTFSSITKAKIAVKGNSASHISEACRGIFQTAYGYQWRYTSEGLKQLEPVPDHCIKAVAQYDFNGKLITVFQSMAEAAKAVKGSDTSISRVCNGKQKIAYNYQWRFFKEKIEELEPIKPKGVVQAIVQYDLNGNYVATYPSAADASKATGIDNTSILACAQNKRKTAGNNQWKYAYEEIEQLNPIKVGAGKGQYRVTSVCQYDLDEKYIATYCSIAEASRVTGIRAGGISDCINGKQKTCGNYIWRKVIKN